MTALCVDLCVVWKSFDGLIKQIQTHRNHHEDTNYHYLCYVLWSLIVTIYQEIYTMSPNRLVKKFSKATFVISAAVRVKAALVWSEF